MDTSAGADGGEEQESVTTTAGGNPNEPPVPAPASLFCRHQYTAGDVCAHCAWRVSKSGLFLGTHSYSLRKAAHAATYYSHAAIADVRGPWKPQSARLANNNSGNPNEATSLDNYSGLRNNSNNSSGGGVAVDDVSIFDDDMPDLEYDMPDLE